MLYEAMKGVGEGVLIALVLLIVYVLAVVLIDAARARRERHDDLKRAERFRRHGLAVLLLMALALGLGACTGDEDEAEAGSVGPSAVASPSPSPSPSPTPDPRCEPRYCDILGDSIVFGIGPKQERELKLLVLDSFRTPIDNKCEYPRRIAWSHDGPIQPVGSRSGSAFRYYALTTGDANVYVEVGDRANCRFSIRIEE